MALRYELVGGGWPKQAYLFRIVDVETDTVLATSRQYEVKSNAQADMACIMAGTGDIVDETKPEGAPPVPVSAYDAEPGRERSGRSIR